MKIMLGVGVGKGEQALRKETTATPTCSGSRKLLSASEQI